MRVTATTLLAATAALTTAQRGPWRDGNNYGPFGNNACLSSCISIDSSCSRGNITCHCNNDIADLNDCIESSNCSGQEKEDTYQAVAQACANAGATVTASPQATFSATSGESVLITTWDGFGGDGWRQSWASGHSQDPGLQSLSNVWPTASSFWASFASEEGLPTDVAASGGSDYPTASWASALSGLATMTKSGDGYGPNGAWGPGGNWHNDENSGRGWKAGNGHGPFGPGGRGNGWGPWESHSDGDWTAGPWTSWWGGNGNGCPGSSWSGWTNGPWATEAPWTTWSGCQASTTATSTVTNTMTNSAGDAEVSTSLDYGIQVAAATLDATAVANQDTSDSAAIGARGKSVEAGLTALIGGVLAVAVGVGAMVL